MPFIVVYGIPAGTSRAHLRDLKAQIVATLSLSMKAPPNWIRTFFVADMLADDSAEILSPVESCSTIYVRLDTGMFNDKNEAQATAVTADLAHVIWRSFDGLREVEVFVGELNPALKTIIHSK